MTARVGLAVLPAGDDSAGLGAELARADAPGLDWVRLDDTVFYWAEDGAGWDEAQARARSAGVPLEERRAPGTAADLRLVTQVGRVFQQEHPDVPVLADKGRYLVVSLDEDHRARIRPHPGLCYRVEPLPAGGLVFRSAAATPREPDPRVQAMVDEVSGDAYRDVLTRLVGLGTRHSLGQGFRDAAELAGERLRELGYTVSEVPITVGPGRSANVVAERLAAHRRPRETVLVTAHLDSINVVGGPAAPAPGADDNGSGSAGLLEMARVLASAGDAEHDLRLILFGGEEEGLFGSTQYVASLPPEERAAIGTVINMDMIASVNTAAPSVLLEGGQVSAGLIGELAAAAATYTELGVQTSLRPFNSDHVPFIDASIPAVLTIEGADDANHHVHTASDTLDTVDPSLALEIVRMNLAVAASAPR
ncbi:M28 family metallopeptidase [Actinomadura roseirufa]|uniref:M28 family metallopeptidase n=1 Tax=Actinomadura roseirufa TaxID=2094049 RepID=UPI001A955034|nr:M28 family peptidase [Actinomadura roseirufa]